MPRVVVDSDERETIAPLCVLKVMPGQVIFRFASEEIGRCMVHVFQQMPKT